MAVTATFTLRDVCGGGNHATLTATIGGQVVTMPISRDEIKAPITPDDRETFCRVLSRILVRQLAGSATAAQIKTALEAKTIDLTVT